MNESRKIDIHAAPNFRDLGGYPTVDGKQVKWGLVFRSDDLSNLSESDLDKVAQLGIRTVVDFRTAQEASYLPDRLPSTVQKSVNIPVDAGKLVGNFYGGTLNRRKVIGIMVSVYRQLINEFTASYRQFFELLADSENLPLLFHCTAGKDRTGLGAALFLSALGVDRRQVLYDYMRSAECLKRKYQAGRDYDEIMEPLYTVYPEFIQAAFAVVDDLPGGVEAFLRDQLGVDIEHFRKVFTE